MFKPFSIAVCVYAVRAGFHYTNSIIKWSRKMVKSLAITTDTVIYGNRCVHSVSSFMFNQSIEKAFRLMLLLETFHFTTKVNVAESIRWAEREKKSSAINCPLGIYMAFLSLSRSRSHWKCTNWFLIPNCANPLHTIHPAPPIQRRRKQCIHLLVDAVLQSSTTSNGENKGHFSIKPHKNIQ